MRRSPLGCAFLLAAEAGVHHATVVRIQGKYSVAEGDAIPVFPHQSAITIEQIRAAAGA
jgi:hypothetical protein